jgi:hypothetical protein
MVWLHGLQSMLVNGLAAWPTEYACEWSGSHEDASAVYPACRRKHRLSDRLIVSFCRALRSLSAFVAFPRIHAVNEIGIPYMIHINALTRVYAFYAWGDYLPQSGALDEGTSQPKTRVVTSRSIPCGTVCSSVKVNSRAMALNKRKKRRAIQ